MSQCARLTGLARRRLKSDADNVGRAKAYERVSDCRERFGGDNWAPAPMLD